eukprot:4376741-Amphidinium_carterae.1
MSLRPDECPKKLLCSVLECFLLVGDAPEYCDIELVVMAEQKTALEQAWATKGKVKALPKISSAKDIAAQVRKAIHDSCKWATAEEIDGVVDPATGLTLRGRIARDKELVASKQAQITFGRISWVCALNIVSMVLVS